MSVVILGMLLAPPPNHAVLRLLRREENISIPITLNYALTPDYHPVEFCDLVQPGGAF